MRLEDRSGEWEAIVTFKTAEQLENMGEQFFVVRRKLEACLERGDALTSNQVEIAYREIGADVYWIDMHGIPRHSE